MEVEPGTEVLIRVQPTELVTDDAVIDVPVEKRGCRLASEVPEEMTMHNENLTKDQWKKPQKLIAHLEKCYLRCLM